MTRLLRSLFAAALALCAAAALAVPAFAMDGIDAGAPCSVTLTVQEKYQEDLAESTTTVDIYKVADLSGSGVFTLTAPFASLGENEQWNGGHLGPETRMQDLQTAALALIVPEEESAAPLLPPDSTEEVPVVDGEVRINGAELYLLILEPVQTNSQTYSFSPIMLALPAAITEDDAGGVTYDVSVTLKTELEDRLTDLVIDKTLISYNKALGPTTFLFAVEAEQEGEIVYSNVVGLTFSGAGTQSVTVSGIPAESHVTVTEVYSGGSYAPTDGRVSVDIPSLPLAEESGAAHAGFTNDYSGVRVPDRTVTNTFQFDGTGWKWLSSEEAG